MASGLKEEGHLVPKGLLPHGHCGNTKDSKGRKAKETMACLPCDPHSFVCVCPWLGFHLPRSTPGTLSALSCSLPLQDHSFSNGGALCGARGLSHTFSALIRGYLFLFSL